MLKEFNENQKTDLIQKTAWRLVRSAEDRIVGQGRGPERLIWCVERMREEFPKAKNGEDYIRAAFVNYPNENRALFA